jgi:hypothetical protein
MEENRNFYIQSITVYYANFEIGMNGSSNEAGYCPPV